MAARQQARAESAKRELARRDLLHFCQYVDPNYTTSKHLRFMSEALMRWDSGESPRMILAVAQRHGKSRLACEMLPPWSIGRNRDAQFLIGTNTETLGHTFSRNARNLIGTEEYQDIFGGIRISGDSANVKTWTIDGALRPTFQVFGVGGSPTGRGGTHLIIDDPFGSYAEFNSATYRDTVYNWYVGSMRNRLEPRGRVLIIMQRGHTDDLVGRLVRDAAGDGEKFEVIVLPGLAESQSLRDETHAMYGLPAGLPDPIGRAEGEALWPERWPADELIKLRGVSAQEFEARSQQRPRAAGGSVFRREWMRIVDADSLPQGLRWVRFWDTAYSTKTTADNTATISGARHPETGMFYLRRGYAARLETPDIRRAIKQYMLSEGGTHGIEKSLHGGGIVQDLLRDPEVARVGLRAVPVDGDKVSRATPVADRFEMGKIAFVRESPADDVWIEQFIRELVAFPRGEHDDRVDAITGAYSLAHAASKGVYL